MKKDRGILVRGLPEPLRRAFKAKCAQEGRTMSEAIRAFILRVLKHKERGTDSQNTEGDGVPNN